MPACASARLACRSHGEEMAFARRARGRLSARTAAGSDAQQAAQRYRYALAGEKGHTIASGRPRVLSLLPPLPLLAQRCEVYFQKHDRQDKNIYKTERGATPNDLRNFTTPLKDGFRKFVLISVTACRNKHSVFLKQIDVLSLHSCACLAGVRSKRRGIPRGRWLEQRVRTRRHWQACSAVESLCRLCGGVCSGREVICGRKRLPRGAQVALVCGAI